MSGLVCLELVLDGFGLDVFVLRFRYSVPHHLVSVTWLRYTSKILFTDSMNKDLCVCVYNKSDYLDWTAFMSSLNSLACLS